MFSYNSRMLSSYLVRCTRTLDGIFAAPWRIFSSFFELSGRIFAFFYLALVRGSFFLAFWSLRAPSGEPKTIKIVVLSHENKGSPFW